LKREWDRCNKIIVSDILTKILDAAKKWQEIHEYSALSDCENRTKAFLKLVSVTKALSYLVSDTGANKSKVSDLKF
jgi:hypothetical protein